MVRVFIGRRLNLKTFIGRMMRMPMNFSVFPTFQLPSPRTVKLLLHAPLASFQIAARSLFSLAFSYRMDALFPKRKSTASGVKSGKVSSAASYKSRDPVYGAYDEIGTGGGSIGAVDSQPAALISSGRKDLNEDYDDVEEILRQFDMNMAYGPCLGVSRLERFDRARRLGLNPPLDVKNLLERVGGKPDALWEGRV